MVSVPFSSVTQSCPTLWDPMDHSTPGVPVHHQLLKFTQTHVHRVSDAIRPSHPLSSPSLPVLNLSQHQGLFKWVSSSLGGQSIGVSASTSVFPVNSQDWSPLRWTGWTSLQSKGLTRVFSSTTSPASKASILWRLAFFTIQLSHPYMTTGKTLAYMPASLENSAVATGLEKVSFHSDSKERQCKRMLKLPHNWTHLTS